MRLLQAALLVLLVSAPGAAQPFKPRLPVAAAEWLLKRTVKERASSFRLELIPRAGGKDVFELSAKGGNVTIRGSGALALSRGFYHYLRSACNSEVTWSGSHIALPEVLPDYPLTRVVSPYLYRQFYNVCTFGYTTVWWDWKRWEREIDWMALHGISMPLAMTGEEAVWRNVWRSMGITDSELDAYFTGPAFLPWHRMGNVNGHGGPLPQGWIDAQASLQKRILARMRALGMTPVVPAFSGFVPPAFKRLHPDALVYDIGAWGGFPKENRTHILSPASPLFREIGKAFITEYRKMFGTDHFYLADSFNELEVPVSDTARYRELAQFGEAVYASITAGDPAGTWVMQGWLFYNDRTFWDKPSARALISRVPGDRMIILDLANELFHGWKEHEGFYGKEWIYSIIHNFGGNNPLTGNLAFTASDPVTALRSPARGNLAGMGLAPEGIENNDVLYELSTDMMWSGVPISPDVWLDAYARSRYGLLPESVREAWHLLAASAYAKGSTNIRHGFQMRPRKTVQGNVDVSDEFREAARMFLSASDTLRGNPLYTADAIEIAAQVLGGAVDARLRDAIRAHDAGMPGLRDTLFGDALRLMNGIDALLGCREDRTLESWIASARAWGTTPGDSALYEENARLQVTVWGGPELFDYASKMWSGLVRDFYAARWKKFFEILRRTPPGEPVPSGEIASWEESWTKEHSLSPPVPVGDPLRAARDLLASAEHSTVLTPEPAIGPDLQVFSKAESLLVVLHTDVPGGVIRYTLDGSLPTASSRAYAGPFRVGSDVTVSARTFGASAYPSFVASRSYAAVEKGVNGLSFRYYEGSWRAIPDFDTVAVARRGIAYGFSLAEAGSRSEFFALEYSGYIDIPAPGEYTFTLGSDDGSRLLIDGTAVVNNDGLHPYAEESAAVKLSAGKHALTVRYFQAGGGKRLELRYKGPGVPEEPIPPGRLFITR
ncbi:MAG TPA: alpha-N-acetylglucosaminidase TIM-barrel domain-containing protein [Bacteroidota bacterium]|nr:alpha-N-acetylglucosaminidase TIM-barrel domain-containing protein [Bacteroidota bacterium]